MNLKHNVSYNNREIFAASKNRTLNDDFTQKNQQSWLYAFKNTSFKTTMKNYSENINDGINLTSEQEDIINTAQHLKRNEILKINACAGSGKTFTLRKIAESMPNKKFLYLAFNKSVVEEIKTKMPNNVDVKTIHSLAYAYAKSTLGDFNINTKLNIFSIKKFVPSLKDNQLFIMIDNFQSFCKNDSPLNKIDKLSLILWKLMLKKEIDITHDFYLKLYGLSDKKNLSKYDFILLDEAQDTNKVMLNIFLNNNCSKILVGDTFQNIYGFNETINALLKVEANFSKELSYSFRSNQKILDYANFMLKNFSSEFTFSNEMKSSSIDGEPKTKAFITRTNTGIIKFISDIVEQNLPLNKFKLVKNPDSIFEAIFAIYDFQNGSKLSKKYSFLDNFNTLNEIKEYANECLDNELLFAIDFIKNRNKENIEALYDIANLLYNNKNKEANNFITNAHLSKGLEWDIVELFYDFPSFLTYAEATNGEIIGIGKELQKNKRMSFDVSARMFNIQQEINLFYVAITRAKYKLIDKSANRNIMEFFSKKNIDIRKTILEAYNGESFHIEKLSDNFKSFKKQKENNRNNIEIL